MDPIRLNAPASGVARLQPDFATQLQRPGTDSGLGNRTPARFRALSGTPWPCSATGNPRTLSHCKSLHCGAIPHAASNEVPCHARERAFGSTPPTKPTVSSPTCLRGTPQPFGSKTHTHVGTRLGPPSSANARVYLRKLQLKRNEPRVHAWGREGGGWLLFQMWDRRSLRSVTEEGPDEGEVAHPRKPVRKLRTGLPFPSSTSV